MKHVWICALLCSAVLLASARGGAASETVALQPGSIEVGFAGSLLTVEGTTTGVLRAHAGPSFAAPGAGLLALQAECGFSRVRSLKQLDLQANLGWEWPLGHSNTWPFVAVGGGVQQQWLGSFRTARYPLGIDVGMRTVLSTLVGIRAAYRYRRLFNDPVADFNEHQIELGLVLFLRNKPRPGNETGEAARTGPR